MWGLFGEKDELGMPNLLTPEVVAAAAKEIKSGVRTPLDLPLTFVGPEIDYSILVVVQAA